MEDLTWEELRGILNDIEKSSDKDSLHESVELCADGVWTLDLVVSCKGGKLSFIYCSEE